VHLTRWARGQLWKHCELHGWLSHRRRSGLQPRPRRNRGGLDTTERSQRRRLSNEPGLPG